MSALQKFDLGPDRAGAKIVTEEGCGKEGKSGMQGTGDFGEKGEELCCATGAKITITQCLHQGVILV